MRASKVLFLVALLAPAAIEAQISVRPGQYEYSFEMDLGPGSKEALDTVFAAAGAGTQKQKVLQCVTAEDVKEMKDAESIVKVFTREIEADGDCKISDAKAVGNKLTYTATCVDGNSRMTMITEMTFSGDSLTATTKGTDYDGRPITSKLSAKRVGECPK